MAAVIRKLNTNRSPERKMNIYSFFHKVWTMANYFQMAEAIGIENLKLIDIDELIEVILNLPEQPIKSPVEYVKGDYPIYHLHKFKDKKQKLLSKPGPKPSKRKGKGAGEGATALE